MSAFIVSHDHIDALITFAIDQRVSYWCDPLQTRIVITDENATETGKILLAENQKSVGYRYKETDPANMPGCVGECSDNYCFRRWPSQLTAVAVLKGCNCLDYQSCEHIEWEHSRAHAILGNIEHTAIRCVPGYEDAPGWEFRRPSNKPPAPKKCTCGEPCCPDCDPIGHHHGLNK
jgi:hypothetical protein